MPFAHRFEELQDRLLPLRTSLLEHPLYAEIRSVENLRLFMSHHVFAVWDFMSLLKAMQRRLCCVDVPWLPPADGHAARFVNEIVLAEESDDDGAGGFAGHFDLYHRAMSECGADTTGIDQFLERLRRGNSVHSALVEGSVPESVKRFVESTFDVIESGDLPCMASAFTFGREDLLPDVFQRIVDQLNEESTGSLDAFAFYLGRHIELDGDHHGPMAARFVTSLCGDDDQKWQSVESAAVAALEARKGLWDGMLAAMQVRRRASA